MRPTTSLREAIATITRTELLEREGPLLALGTALADAGRGSGSAVVVSGEPGIGKSALVSHFLADHAGRARVLLGVCDDLTTRRPLGAFRDLATELPDALADVMLNPRAAGEFAAGLVSELRSGPVPAALVVEDVHWADQATIDALTVVARRVPELPVLLVLTLRPGELEPAHRLRAAIDGMRRGTMLHVELAPLSRGAVAELAGEESDRIYDLSRGNPFFVTELLAHGSDPPPPSLANAVLGRVARLDAPARNLLELVSVVPGRVDIRVLDLAEPGWAAAADVAERHQLLVDEGHHVSFRHELTRAAVCSSLMHAHRRLLHRRILDALLELGADPADIVHHAEGAGATEVVAGHVLDAARQADAVGATREAFAHYRRAADFADRLTSAEQASMFESLAHSAWLVGRIDDALGAASRAIDLAEQLGDAVRHGRCSSLRAHLHWFSGQGEAAWRDACAGVHSLEASGPSLELARACVQSCELSMLASHADEAFEWGRRALQLAGPDDEVRARALAAVGTMRLQLDPDDVEPLLTALQVAADSGHHEQVAFSLIALAYVNQQWVRPGVARVHAEQGRAYARGHEFDSMVEFVTALLAGLRLREGDAEPAAALGHEPAHAGTAAVGTLAGLHARTVMAELAVRRGDDDADRRLSELVVEVDRTGELSRLGPVLELQVERALTCGAPLPVERFQRIARIVGPQTLAAGGSAGRVASWAAVCGVPVRFSGTAPAPHEAMIAGDWRGAAEAFGAVGWHHDRALVLSLTDSEEALVEGLDIARSLSAAPLEQRICLRLRALGRAVPRGPSSTTQANPAQLTPRQLEVLRHIRRGEGNARIAEVLHISPRTVEHHVAGIFSKLGVGSRAEAVARCADLDIA